MSTGLLTRAPYNIAASTLISPLARPWTLALVKPKSSENEIGRGGVSLSSFSITPCVWVVRARVYVRVLLTNNEAPIIFSFRHFIKARANSRCLARRDNGRIVSAPYIDLRTFVSLILLIVLNLFSDRCLYIGESRRLLGLIRRDCGSIR